MVDRLASGDLRGAWLASYSSTMEVPNFGPPAGAWAGILHAAFGMNHIAFHVSRTVLFSATLLGLYALGRRSGFARFPAALGPVLYATMQPGIILPDFQTYAANWFRLFTTDTYTVLLQVALFHWFLTTVRGEAKPALGYPLLGLVGCLAFTSKVSAIPFLGVLLLHAGILAAWREVPWKRALMVSLTLCVSCIPALAMYQLIGGAGGDGVSGASLDPEVVGRGLRLYSDMLLDSLGVVPCAGLFAAGIQILRRGCRPRRAMMVSMLCAGLGMLFVMSAWPHVLPRYLATSAPWLCCAFGWGLGDWIGEPGRRGRIPVWTVRLLQMFLGGVVWAVACLPLWRATGSDLQRFAPPLFLLGTMILPAAAWLVLRVAGSPLAERLRRRMLLIPATILAGSIPLQVGISAIATADFVATYSVEAKSDGDWMGFLVEEARRNPARTMVAAIAANEWSAEPADQVGRYAELATGRRAIVGRTFQAADLVTSDLIVAP